MTSVTDIYVNVADDNGQSLMFTPQTTGPCLVFGDRELLTQLFVNLIENAINHCPAGTRISVALAAEANSIIASVADNGPGIPPGEREMVFQRLYRLDKSRTTPGSGLGLSLVRAVADLHAAQLKLDDNEPGLKISLLLARH